MLAWLLLGLWPLTLVAPPSELLNNSFTRHPPATLSARRPSRHRFSVFGNRLARLGRRWTGRGSDRLVQDDIVGSAILSQSAIATTRRLVFSPARSIINLELPQSWQFLWRTALEPRAPCA
jgi:hypothetical protein